MCMCDFELVKKFGDIMYEVELNVSNEHELVVRERNVSAIKAERSVELEDTIVCCVPSKPVRMVVTGQLVQFIRGDE